MTVKPTDNAFLYLLIPTNYFSTMDLQKITMSAVILKAYVSTKNSKYSVI